MNDPQDPSPQEEDPISRINSLFGQLESKTVERLQSHPDCTRTLVDDQNVLTIASNVTINSLEGDDLEIVFFDNGRIYRINQYWHYTNLQTGLNETFRLRYTGGESPADSTLDISYTVEGFKKASAEELYGLEQIYMTHNVERSMIPNAQAVKNEISLHFDHPEPRGSAISFLPGTNSMLPISGKELAYDDHPYYLFTEKYGIYGWNMSVAESTREFTSQIIIPSYMTLNTGLGLEHRQNGLDNMILSFLQSGDHMPLIQTGSYFK